MVAKITILSVCTTLAPTPSASSIPAPTPIPNPVWSADTTRFGGRVVANGSRFAPFDSVREAGTRGDDALFNADCMGAGAPPYATWGRATQSPRVIVVRIDKNPRRVGSGLPTRTPEGPPPSGPSRAGPYAIPRASARPTAGHPKCLRFLGRFHKYFMPVFQIATALYRIASATSSRGWSSNG